MTTVAWFSAGVSSAVATKLVLKEVDRIIYTHIDDQHPDTMRFVKDCESWFDRPIEIMQSDYKDVESACLGAGGRGYINGPTGAACTKRLKRDLRIQWEKGLEPGPLKYVWGLDLEERHRIVAIEEAMPMIEQSFPLALLGMDKREVHRVFAASKIPRPVMYELGFHNNNCIGCVKGGMGYWQLIRKYFPEVFEARAIMERKIGASCIKDKKGRVYLDELHPDRGRDLLPIVSECGAMCEALAL